MERVRNIAAFPLAIPLMAGPGAITATVLLARADPMRLTVLLAVIAFVAVLCAAVFLLCTHIGKLLGVTGNIVLSAPLGAVADSRCNTWSTACAPRWRKGCRPGLCYTFQLVAPASCNCDWVKTLNFCGF